MKIPTGLKHRPVLLVENYEKMDGNYDPQTTDAKGLSLGIAQWTPITDQPDKMDISAKVWRYTGEKWSRQSEELPIHRVLDLATLICYAILRLDNSSNNPNSSQNLSNDENQNKKILPITFSENERNRHNFYNCLKREKQTIIKRLENLSALLKKILD